MVGGPRIVGLGEDQRDTERVRNSKTWKPCTPGPNTHHLWRFIHIHMRLNKLSSEELARQAGVSDTSVRAHISGRGSNFDIRTVELCLQVLGYGLKPTILEEK